MMRHTFCRVKRFRFGSNCPILVKFVPNHPCVELDWLPIPFVPDFVIRLLLLFWLVLDQSS